MTPILLEAQTADSLWLKVATLLQQVPDDDLQPSRSGLTRELLHVTMSIRDPRQRWALSREPALNPAFAIAEVIWILSGRDDSAFLKYFNSELPRYAGSGTRFHGAYGYRLRKRFEFDQISRAYQVLRRNPESRQVVLQIWDTTIDMPHSDGSPTNSDIPCNIISLLKVRSSALEWTQIMRSNDLLLGLPYNIVQFTSLQEIMAGWLGLDVGPYYHFSDSLHVYEDRVADLKLVSPRAEIANPDRLNLSVQDTERAVGAIDTAISRFIDDNQSASAMSECRRLINDLPRAYANLFSILVAEAARRAGDHSSCMAALDRCENPDLKELMHRWIERLSTPQNRKE